VTRTQAAHRATFQRNFRVALAAAAPLTQEQLARELGITLRAVSKWATGHGEPSAYQLVALGAALDRDPAWFYDDTTEEEAA
jgi:transcriptional regulator with XRE-family HTH domain